MVKTFSAIFYLRNPKNYEKGEIPIYLRIILDSKTAEISIGREADSDIWDSKNGKLPGKGEKVKQFNAYLDSLKSKLFDAQQALIRENKIITAESLKNKYTGASEKQRMLVPIFQKHNDEVAALVPKDFAPGMEKPVKLTPSLHKPAEFIEKPDTYHNPHGINVVYLYLGNSSKKFRTRCKK